MKELKNDSRLNRIIFLFPIMFILHDGEEILTMANWIKTNTSYLYGKVPEQLHFVIDSVQMTTLEIAIAVLVELIILSVVTILFVRAKHVSIWANLYTAIITIFFLNSFTHIFQSIVYGGYTPGVVTAVVVAFPYSLIVIRTLFRERIIVLRNFKIVPFIVILFLPVVPLAHFIGRYFG